MSADLVINLSSLCPEKVSPALVSGLGYPSSESCISGLQSGDHFSGYSFWHLAEMERQRCAPALEVQDLSRQTIGVVERLLLNQQQDCLVVEVGPIQLADGTFLLVENENRLQAQAGLASGWTEVSDWVQHVCLQDHEIAALIRTVGRDLAQDQFHYRLVNAAGHLTPVRHEARVVGRTTNGAVLQNQLFTLPEVPRAFRLFHAAEVTKCEVRGDAAISNLLLDDLICAVRLMTTLKQQGMIVLSVDQCHDECSLCGIRVPGLEGYPVISLAGQAILPAEWHRYTQNLHAMGYHFSAGLPGMESLSVHLLKRKYVD